MVGYTIKERHVPTRTFRGLPKPVRIIWQHAVDTVAAMVRIQISVVQRFRGVTNGASRTTHNYGACTATAQDGSGTRGTHRFWTYRRNRCLEACNIHHMGYSFTKVEVPLVGYILKISSKIWPEGSISKGRRRKQESLEVWEKIG